jgi:hypothetical protein
MLVEKTLEKFRIILPSHKKRNSNSIINITADKQEFTSEESPVGMR